MDAPCKIICHRNTSGLSEAVAKRPSVIRQPASYIEVKYAAKELQNGGVEIRHR
jgi:hypothetical protein